MPRMLNVDWGEIKRAAEMGADLRILAQSFQVDIETIRKRSQREQWLVPHRLHDRLAAAQALSKPDALDALSRECPPHVLPSLLAKKAELQKLQDKDKAEAAIAETWETRGELIRSQAWMLAQKSLEPAIRSGLMITTIKEAQTAVEMARKATGQFAETPLISVGIFGEQHDAIMEDAIDIPSSMPEVMEDADFWE